VTAAVSAGATLGKVVKVWQTEDGDDAEFPGHGRRVHISWQASCGPAAPADVYTSVDVSLVGIHPDGTRHTFYGPYSSYDLVGSRTYPVGPGTRFVAEVTITCRAYVSGGDDHVSTATASSAELYLPPEVVANTSVFPIRISCQRIPISKLSVWLQRGEQSLLTWHIWHGASIMAPGIPEARQIRLYARGAGIRLARSPSRRMLRRYRALGAPVTPRRGGTLYIWASVNGQLTNKLPVKVLPERC
jgi:hypothetical protein